MARFRYLTAGESHGPALTVIIDGMPAGVEVSTEDINGELAKRQRGYGRGGRMSIETDRAEILSGIRHGLTTGGPISLLIRNSDNPNWIQVMSPKPVEDASERKFTVPRPGHADLAGSVKYGHSDLRDVLERASARETAARVAAGAVAKRLLISVGMEISAWVTGIGDAEIEGYDHVPTFQEVVKADDCDVRCPDEGVAARMRAKIDDAKSLGDTVGGTFEVFAWNVPVGLGSHVQWDRKLDALIAMAFMSIPAIKGVEIGDGFELSERMGSLAHDQIYLGEDGEIIRHTNHAGGIEGGMSNGMPIKVRAVMKPIPTLRKPLSSVDIETGLPSQAHSERSDVCAVPAASVVGEAMLAIVLADAIMDRFGSDSLGQIEEAMRYEKRR